MPIDLATYRSMVGRWQARMQPRPTTTPTTVRPRRLSVATVLEGCVRRISLMLVSLWSQIRMQRRPTMTPTNVRPRPLSVATVLEVCVKVLTLMLVALALWWQARMHSLPTMTPTSLRPRPLSVATVLEVCVRVIPLMLIALYWQARMQQRPTTTPTNVRPRPLSVVTVLEFCLRVILLMLVTLWWQARMQPLPTMTPTSLRPWPLSVATVLEVCVRVIPLMLVALWWQARMQQRPTTNTTNVRPRPLSVATMLEVCMRVILLMLVTLYWQVRMQLLPTTTPTSLRPWPLSVVTVLKFCLRVILLMLIYLWWQARMQPRPTTTATTVRPRPPMQVSLRWQAQMQPRPTTTPTTVRPRPLSVATVLEVCVRVISLMLVSLRGWGSSLFTAARWNTWRVSKVIIEGRWLFRRSVCNVSRLTCRSAPLLLKFSMVVMVLLLLRGGDVESNPGPETQLRLHDLGSLKRILQPVSAYWVPLADQLDMTSQVATIRGTPDNRGPSAFMRDLLNRWLSRERPSPTLEALCQALRGDGEIIGGANVAKKLEETFQGQQETHTSGQHPGMRSSQQTPQHLVPVPVHSGINAPKPRNILRKYAEYLRRKYQTGIPSVSLQWPPTPTRKVFNLAMIQQETKYLRDEECARLLLRGDVAGVMRKNTEVKLEDIVKPDDESNMILIEGAPGAGKSTLAWHICQKWGAGELFQEFVMIIFMQLRDLDIQSATTLANILPDTDHGPKPEEVISAIKDCDGKHVLFVLDGWDELPPGLLHKDSIIKCLICRPADFGMSSRTLIITSRPVATAELRRFASSRVEIVGFQQAEMKRYFTEALYEPQIVQKLEDHLKLRPVIEASCYLPLNAAIVVHIFLALNHSLPTTLHGVFTSLVLCCITRHLARQAEEIPDISSLNDLPPDIQEPFNNICTLAYHGVRENKPTFSKADLQSYHLPTELSTLSLIQAVNSFTFLGKSKSYSFLHLSVQELLAAFHISRTSPEQQVKIFDELFEEPHFAAVFQFYAAFTKLQSEGVRKVVTRIVQEESTLLLLSLLRCLYETRDVSLCKFVASQLNGELDLSEESVSPVDCLSVGYFLNSVCLTTSGEFNVNLGDCGLNGYCISLLWKELFECSGTPAVGAGVEGHLHLSLSANDVGDEGATVLASALKKNKTLKTLNLGSNEFGDEGATVLASALKKNETLKTLDLYHCSVTSTGAIALGEGLQDNNSLEELDLSDNRIGDAGAVPLGEALRVNHSLKTLDLRSNEIGDAGAVSLGEALRVNHSLKTLSLRNNRIGDAGAVSLREALRVNHSLITLNLGYNRIGDGGAVSLGEALRVNHSLETLFLNFNRIGDGGAVSLGEALRVNHSLKTLNLTGQGYHGGDKISSEKQTQLTQEFGSRIVLGTLY